MSAPSKSDGAAVRAVDSGDYVEKCCLARPIGSDQADDFVRHDGKIKIVQRHDAAKSSGQSASLQQIGHARPPGK